MDGSCVVGCSVSSDIQQTIHMGRSTWFDSCSRLKVVTHWDIQFDAKTRATTATDTCLKVDYVCNVVVVFITATVGSTLHILPTYSVNILYC